MIFRKASGSGRVGSGRVGSGRVESSLSEVDFLACFLMQS
jgi:hypothetical protein